MTPTDPEVRRAQGWLRLECEGQIDGFNSLGVSSHELAELLAAYENRAESQLSPLREGLRKVTGHVQHSRLYLDSHYSCVPNCLRCEAERILSTSEGSRK